MLAACSGTSRPPDGSNDAPSVDVLAEASTLDAGDVAADAPLDVSLDAQGDAALDAATDAGDAAVADGTSTDANDAVADAADGSARCRRDIDCRGTPATSHCDPASGACVQCVPFGDDCPTGSYCGASDTCLPGCRDATDCAAGDAGVVCNTTMHMCVGCNTDTDCMLGTVCTTGTCVPGCSTTHACPTGQSCCGGACFATQTDPTHCGTCTTVCGSTNAMPACVAGVCNENCATGFGDCDSNTANGCEMDVSANSANCGACGAVCRLTNAVAMCSSSTCNIISCSTGFQDCDRLASTGCEANPQTDPLNCGTCGVACPTGRVCTAGVCACPGATSPCPGGCFNLQTDSTNCGGCGLICPSGRVCIAGACTLQPLYHGWTCPIAGCSTTSYNTTAATADGGLYPYNTGDSANCRAWKLAATICNTQPVGYGYTPPANWSCPSSGGFTDPLFGTYCAVANQYSCSDCYGLCNSGTCSYRPLSLRNCSGSETSQP